jgi:hypothetical protein
MKRACGVMDDQILRFFEEYIGMRPGFKQVQEMMNYIQGK